MDLAAADKEIEVMPNIVKQRVSVATFYSKEGANYMTVQLYPDIPRLELSVGTHPPCVLTGEDVGKLTAWLQNPDYKLPR